MSFMFGLFVGMGAATWLFVMIQNATEEPLANSENIQVRYKHDEAPIARLVQIRTRAIYLYEQMEAAADECREITGQQRDSIGGDLAESIVYERADVKEVLDTLLG